MHGSKNRTFFCYLDYYFVERDEMVRGIENGEFIESAEYSKNLYGTR